MLHGDDKKVLKSILTVFGYHPMLENPEMINDHYEDFYEIIKECYIIIFSYVGTVYRDITNEAISISNIFNEVFEGLNEDIEKELNR